MILKKMNLVFECSDIDSKWRSFIVKSDELVLVDLTYERITVFEDNWSTEDDLDMFAWISGIYSKGRLACIL